jgi:hypothetical protein
MGTQPWEINNNIVVVHRTDNRLDGRLIKLN